MASSADEALPSLPPIKTAPLAPSPPAGADADAASAAPSPASSAQVSTTAEDVKKEAAAAEEEEKEPSTPTSAECRLRQPMECPPAPRKPPMPRLPAFKRKSRPTLTTKTTARACLVVPRDLSTVFRSMPMPAEKRIRAS